MMKKSFYLLTIAAIAVACGNRQATPDNSLATDAISAHQSLPGDSTVYGLACDGCTDSILVFLPYEGGDLDTFDIIDAQKQHRVFGRTHIGDELAVLPSAEDRRKAATVINVNDLQGEWCYKVSPTLCPSVDRQLMRALPDSVMKKLMEPREYGLKLKRDHTVFSTGGTFRQSTTDEQRPVEYPTAKNYTEWHISNGRLILKADTIAGLAEQTAPQSDTVSVVLLRRDSLVLRFADHEQGYYRKQQEQEGRKLP